MLLTTRSTNSLGYAAAMRRKSKNARIAVASETELLAHTSHTTLMHRNPNFGIAFMTDTKCIKFFKMRRLNVASRTVLRNLTKIRPKCFINASMLFHCGDCVGSERSNSAASFAAFFLLSAFLRLPLVDLTASNCFRSSFSSAASAASVGSGSRSIPKTRSNPIMSLKKETDMSLRYTLDDSNLILDASEVSIPSIGSPSSSTRLFSALCDFVDNSTPAANAASKRLTDLLGVLNGHEVTVDSSVCKSSLDTTHKVPFLSFRFDWSCSSSSSPSSSSSSSSSRSLSSSPLKFKRSSSFSSKY
mmetsp:Transcript_10520/g.18064  ORF Transcript_10520/g.18064 Transcript_10520/m.18064 type:complete len:302 (-) Transcript_10520:638-1543(-)